MPRPAALADACGRALRRSLPALAAIGVLGAIGGTAWAGYHFVTTSPRFAIDELAIHGTHQLSSDHVLGELPIRRGDNVFAADLDRAVAALRADPWIADASARRILPHTIAIDIRERTAAALIELGGLYLVDATGHPFKRAAIGSGEGAGLPAITGVPRAGYLADPDAAAAQVQSALGALAQWRSNPARPAIGEVHLGPHGALALYTYDRATAIELGAPSELAARLRTFDAVWAELDDSERARARAIHLDARPDRVTIALSPSLDR